MSNILLNRTCPVEECSYELLKDRIEAIMETLSTEKQQFEKAYVRRIAHYEQELSRKDGLIIQLSQHLQVVRSQCQKAVRQNELYKTMIQDLKQEFSRMENIVAQVSPRKKEKQLKRVKSDYVCNKQRKQTNGKCEIQIKPVKIQFKSIFSNQKVQNQTSRFKPQIEKLQSKLSEQTTTSTVKNAKINKLHFNTLDQKEGSIFTKTMKKWAQRNDYPSSPQRKENYVRIREYKQNQWQQTF